MNRTWAPDVALDVTAAHRIVARRFPAFGSAEPEELGRGWDNLCIRYPDDTVFRLPTRRLGAELIESEMNVLDYLGPRLPLPIPAISYRGESGDDYPYPFMGYSLLSGQTADRLIWTQDARSRNVETLAEFLRTLHSLDPSADSLAGLPPDKLFRKDPPKLLERIEARVAHLRDIENGLPVDPDELLAWARHVTATTEPSPKKTVVHGDLYPRHLIANAEREVTAVIDWGDVHRGHPAIDLSLAYTFVPLDDRERFFELYGAVSASDRRLAQLRAAMYGTSLTAYGLDSADAAITLLGRTVLQDIDLTT